MGIVGWRGHTSPQITHIAPVMCREVFHRQASLAGQMQRMGLSQLADWAPGVKVGIEIQERCGLFLCPSL